MSDSVQDKDKLASPLGRVQDEDVAEAKRIISEAQNTRGTDGDPALGDILTTFIYVLLRDHLPAGQIERAIQFVLSGEMVVFTDSFLAQYADSLANTLKSARVNALANALERVFADKASMRPALSDISDAKKKRAEAHLGDDAAALAELQDKVDQAIEHMNEEDRKAWEERESTALEEVSRNTDAGLKISGDKDRDPAHEARDKLTNASWRKQAKSEKVEPKAEAETETETETEGVGNSTDEPDDKEDAGYEHKLSASLESLDSLKELVPTDTIRQVVDILRQEVVNELVEDKDEVETTTREDILEQRAEAMAEHKATNSEAEQMAKDYVKEQVEEAQSNVKSNAGDEEKYPPPSRGRLSDVRAGKAFPEALDKVFDDESAPKKEEKSEAQKVGEKLFSGEGPTKHPGLFQRVE